LRAAGCYDFVIYDSYGDGICCAYGNGNYTVTDSAGTVLASGGSYGRSETTNFCVTDTINGSIPSPVIADIKSVSSLQLYPIPANDVLNIEYFFASGSQSPTELAIFDLAGRVLLQKTIPHGELNKTVNVFDLPEGMYVLVLKQGEETMNEKFIVKH